MRKKAEFFSPGKVIGGLLLLVGAVFVYMGGPRVYHAYTSLRWPQVDGTVLSSGVDTYPASKKKVSFTPAVAYSYSFGSNTYVNSQVRFAHPNCNEKTAREIADKYPRGMHVTVYCKPSNPNVSVLEPGVFPNTWNHLILGIFFIVPVILVFGIYWLVTHKPRPSSKDKSENSQAPSNRSILPKILWAVVGLAIVWLIGGGTRKQTPGEELTLIQQIVHLFANGWLSVGLEVFGAAFMILLGITLVYLFSKVTTVPRVTPIGEPGGYKQAPAPRDIHEKELQRLGFRYVADFDVTMLAGVPAQLRVYEDPDHQSVGCLMDATAADGNKVTILEFSTDLHPTGNIATTTSPYVRVLACPPDRIVARVPWKRTATETFALHQTLCRTAREEHFSAETVHTSAIAEKIRESTRRDCEYQVQVGRYRRVGEDRYRLTLWGTIIAVPPTWYQMTHGLLFSWYRVPDRFFCWRLRRRLWRLKRGRGKGAKQTR
jgi:hypothetical protein